MLLIYILILFFTFLFGYQAYLAITNSYFDVEPYSLNSNGILIEGLENNGATNSATPVEIPYSSSDINNFVKITQTNAEDINLLKGKVDNLQRLAGDINMLKGRADNLDEENVKIKRRLDNTEQSVETMQEQINGLVEQQLEYADTLVGSTPIKVSGLE
jgi:hypothetical protein